MFRRDPDAQEEEFKTVRKQLKKQADEHADSGISVLRIQCFRDILKSQQNLWTQQSRRKSKKIKNSNASSYYITYIIFNMRMHLMVPDPLQFIFLSVSHFAAYAAVSVEAFLTVL